jgi:predicted Zn-dependent peptidase
MQTAAHYERSMTGLFSLIFALLPLAGCASAEQVTTTSARLPNGIRLIYVHVPGSKNIAIYSVLSMGLASDDADHAQWSHLVEHLVMRTTMPNDLTHGNAETMAAGMRLDYYGPARSWHDGLSHHQRWLEGLPFTQKSLQTEVPLANSEVDSTAHNLASGKFAIAAWNQAYRHGLDHANVKHDLVTARLADVQRYRDAHLVISDRTVVCAIGGVDSKEFVAGAAEALGNLKSQAKPRRPLGNIKPRDGVISWDVDSTHLIMTWPVPGPEHATDCAALIVLGALFSEQAMADPDTKRFGPYPMAGNDITSPEGDFFEISLTLNPGVKPREARAPLEKWIDAFKTSRAMRAAVPEVARQFSQQLKPPTLALIQSNSGGGERWMIEAQLGLLLAIAEFQYGAHREAVIHALENLKPEEIDRVIDTYLTPRQRTVLVLVPKAGR